MKLLDAPGHSDELYYSRADEVTPARPLFTGDVFTDCPLPGIGDLAKFAMILSHPCSMRAGPRLAKFVIMAAVQPSQNPVPNAAWAKGHYRFMPLPGLIPDAQDRPFYCVNLNLLSTMRSAEIRKACRVACLSEYGIELLQQRHIFNSTRVCVDLPTIHQELTHLFVEAELTEDWATAAIAREDYIGDDTAHLAEQAEQDLQAFLGPADSPRRRNLKDPTKRSLVVREVRREMQNRYKSL